MSLFTSLVGGKLLIGALTVGSVAMGGTAAAAATGTLPTALQQQAHTVFGAPAPATTEDATAEPTDTESPDPTETESPDPTESPEPTDTATPEPADTATPAPATPAAAPVTSAVPASAHGLCTAWSKGGLSTTSVAYTTLLTAAGGSATDLPAWCAPHLMAPGHAKHQWVSGDATVTSGSTVEQSSHGRGHSHASDSTTADAQQADDQQGDDQQGDDQQGDASTGDSGSDSGSQHGGHGSDGSDH